jgi:hypothetical protein
MLSVIITGGALVLLVIAIVCKLAWQKFKRHTGFYRMPNLVLPFLVAINLPEKNLAPDRDNVANLRNIG